MTKTKLTHNGQKTATFVQTGEVEFYLSRPTNSKKGSTFINITGTNPVTGRREKVRLSGRQVTALRNVLA